MADEKLNVSPEENPQPSLFDNGPADAPAPETPAPEPPAPENTPAAITNLEQAAPEKVATKDEVEPEQPPTQG